MVNSFRNIYGTQEFYCRGGAFFFLPETYRGKGVMTLHVHNYTHTHTEGSILLEGTPGSPHQPSACASHYDYNTKNTYAHAWLMLLFWPPFFFFPVSVSSLLYFEKRYWAPMFDL